MNREEFLKIIQEALIGKVSNQIIQDNINYYNNYFNEQLRNGKTESEIINILGDPRLLAKTIEDSNNFAAEEAKTREFNDKTINENNKKINKVKLTIGIVIALIVLILILFMVILFKAISFFMPLILAVFAAVLVYRFINVIFNHN